MTIVGHNVMGYISVHFHQIAPNNTAGGDNI